MIEALVISYLNSVLVPPVSGEIPANVPVTFVTVEKTGSSITNHIETATLAIQSWAGSQADAMMLNKQVKKAMFDMLVLDSISSVDLNTDYNFTDTTTKHHRYQAVFEVVYYIEEE